jgi:hypothetical protein
MSETKLCERSFLQCSGNLRLLENDRLMIKNGFIVNFNSLQWAWMILQII